jgi:hypothetical protein
VIKRRRWGWDPFVTFPAVAGLVLGLIGFSRGFFGPLGIFGAGPLGFVLGVAVGAAAALSRFRTVTFLLTLLASGVVWSGVTLYWSLPGDRSQGLISDAETRGCDLPGTFVAEAIARWERSNAYNAPPRPGWKEDVLRMLENDRGVVLTLFVHRKREVYEQRKPWNRGQLRATRWKSVGELERYFARFAGASCQGYPVGARRFFSPEWEASGVSPPDILPTFLGLNVLEDVPPQFRGFAGP